MTVRNLLILNAALATISGIALLAAPELYVQQFGIALDAAGLAFARMFGTSLLGIAVFTWGVRDLDSNAHRAASAGALVNWASFAVVVAVAVSEGLSNSLGGIWVAIGILMSLAFAGALAGVAFKETATA